MMKYRHKKVINRVAALVLSAIMTFAFAAVGAFSGKEMTAYAKDDVITLRVCNWEEYIDLGEWDRTRRLSLTMEALYLVRIPWLVILKSGTMKPTESV